MIDRSLPRIAPAQVGTKLHQCESLALCLLARYSEQDIPARVLQSFTRAWGMSNLFRRVAVNGGRPGYVVATWPDAGLTRLTVAIEGTRTASQLRTFLGGYNSSVYAPFPGRVYAAFATHADTIYTELMANPSFTQDFNATNVSVCFTGYSLGAAVAEVLACKFKNLHPTKTYQLSKWASPRVGNAAWANGEHLPADRCSFYVQDDPIHLYPYTTMANMSTRALDWAPTHTNYAQNQPRRTFDLRGDTDTTPHADSAVAFARACISAQGALTPTNVWYWHKIEAYRLMMFNDCVRPGASSEDARMRFYYLEYDDDNAWAQTYVAGLLDYAGLTGLNVVPPSDFIVPVEPAREERRMIQAAQHTLRQTPVAASGDNLNMPPLPQGSWRPRRTRDF